MANQQGERIVIDDERMGDSLNDQPYEVDEYLANPERIAMLDKLLEDSVAEVIRLCKEDPDKCSCSTIENGEITLDDLGDSKLGNRALFVGYIADDTKYSLHLTLDDEGKIDPSGRTYLEAFKIYSTQRTEHIMIMMNSAGEGGFIGVNRATTNPETGIMEDLAGPGEVETLEEAKKMEEGVDTTLRAMLGLSRN